VASLRRTVLAFAVFWLVLPGLTRAQEASSRVSRVALLLGGGIAGAGLAFAYISPRGEGWLVSDETAIPLGVATGLGAALIAGFRGDRLAPSLGRRPRLRVTAGTGAGLDLDYSVAYRFPVGSYEVDAGVLVVNNSWDRFETQTRCGGILGCITGTFLTDYASEQIVTALVRLVRPLSPDSEWHPTITVGAGPSLLHAETEAGEYESTGLTFDAGLGIERGQGYRWTAETGLRIMPLGAVDQVDVDGPTWYARVGIAWGG
jgi:hypothetical protein